MQRWTPHPRRALRNISTNSAGVSRNIDTVKLRWDGKTLQSPKVVEENLDFMHIYMKLFA